MGSGVPSKISIIQGIGMIEARYCTDDEERWNGPRVCMASLSGEMFLCVQKPGVWICLR